MKSSLRKINGSSILGVFSLCFLLSFSTLSYSQLSEEGTPPSFTLSELKSAVAINNYTFPEIKIKKLKREDEEFPTPVRYSAFTKVNIDLKKEATSTIVGNKGTIWRYKINSDQAFSIALTFSKYKLPKGAQLFVYNDERHLVYGAFTGRNNKKDGTFTIADYPGRELTLEYFEPENAAFPGELILSEAGQAYRDIFSINEESIQQDEVDINCPAGDPFQLEKHAVAKMTFHDDQYGYLCTGALINTTRSDGTPYFLTANHCISTDTLATTLITYFNFENTDCNGPTQQGRALSGATLLATNMPSDFSLLLLDENPPPSYKPYFAGWDAQLDSVVPWGYGIHHPAGKVKKIAVTHNQIVTYSKTLSWENSTSTPPNTHWGLLFDIGQTEGGSSGSPLFDNQDRIIGQLHGGGDIYDFYGKFSYSYNASSTPARQLQHWLDPDNTGTKIINGYTPEMNDPEAFFYIRYQQVCAGQSVQIQNRSLFEPTGFQWSFSPSNITYYNNTSDTSRNPIISFDSQGMYSISLKATKDGISNTRERKNYIISDTTINVQIISYAGQIISFEDFKDFYLVAKGASEYKWNLSGLNGRLDTVFSTNNDTVYISVKNNVQLDTTVTFSAKVTGNQGTCNDSDSITFNILYPFNDNIENAYPLQTGRSGPFTNQGATVQNHEPNPPDPANACNTQHTWCQCEVSDTILDNSVWFSFTGPESGIAGINVPGFDDQIAVYKADSYSDILSGDTSKYKILAANDDYFGQDSSYSALIEGVQVIPGEKYWVQVDGSACGTYGIFYIDLADHRIGNNPSSIDDLYDKNNISNGIITFPNPVDDIININMPESMKKAKIVIINSDGRIIKSVYLKNVTQSDIIQMNLKSLTPGLYMLKLSNPFISFTSRFIIE